jgi:hypothetical protein
MESLVAGPGISLDKPDELNSFMHLMSNPTASGPSVVAIPIGGKSPELSGVRTRSSGIQASQLIVNIVQ